MARNYDELYDKLETRAYRLYATTMLTREKFMDVVHERIDLPEGFPDQTTTANLVFRKVEKKLAEFQAAAMELTAELEKQTEEGTSE